MKSSAALLVVAIVAILSTPAVDSDPRSGLSEGDVVLGSAGSLAFAPGGVLLVGDTAAAAIYALDTGDRTPGSGSMEVTGIDERIAAMLGTSPDRVRINDLAINPISKRAYLSVSRGNGPEAAALILRVGQTGEIEELSLEGIPHAAVSIANAPAPDATNRRGRSLRVDAITDLAYSEGKVFVAGLSNEEFASKLRTVPYPFQSTDGGASVEIYHGNHGRWETRSPVRTFLPYEIAGEPHLLAAYTCTPLVKFPIESLRPGEKIVGTTIAELGNRNRPLDMIVYEKGGGEFILMSNSSRGVMKMSTAGIETYTAITDRVGGTAGLPYETIDTLAGVEQLDKLDDANAVILARASSLDLKTVALP